MSFDLSGIPTSSASVHIPSGEKPIMLGGRVAPNLSGLQEDTVTIQGKKNNNNDKTTAALKKKLENYENKKAALKPENFKTQEEYEAASIRLDAKIGNIKTKLYGEGQQKEDTNPKPDPQPEQQDPILSIISGFGKVLQGLMEIFLGGGTIMKDVSADVGSAVKDDFGSIIDKVVTGSGDVARDIAGDVAGMKDDVSSAFGKIVFGGGEVVKDVAQDVKNMKDDAASAIGKVFNGGGRVASDISGNLDNIGKGVTSVMGKILNGGGRVILDIAGDFVKIGTNVFSVFNKIFKP